MGDKISDFSDSNRQAQAQHFKLSNSDTTSLGPFKPFQYSDIHPEDDESVAITYQSSRRIPTLPPQQDAAHIYRRRVHQGTSKGHNPEALQGDEIWHPVSIWRFTYCCVRPGAEVGANGYAGRTKISSIKPSLRSLIAFFTMWRRTADQLHMVL